MLRTRRLAVGVECVWGGQNLTRKRWRGYRPTLEDVNLLFSLFWLVFWMLVSSFCTDFGGFVSKRERWGGLMQTDRSVTCLFRSAEPVFFAQVYSSIMPALQLVNTYLKSYMLGYPRPSKDRIVLSTRAHTCSWLFGRNEPFFWGGKTTLDGGPERFWFLNSLGTCSQPVSTPYRYPIRVFAQRHVVHGQERPILATSRDFFLFLFGVRSRSPN